LPGARRVDSLRVMTRRSILAVLLGLPTAACRELRRYHSSVSFSISTDSPAAGEPVVVTFDYLDEAEPGTYELVLMNTTTRDEVDRSPVLDSRTRADLTPPVPGDYTIELRTHGRMTAHRRIRAR
jgi:hypothetical protein